MAEEQEPVAWLAHSDEWQMVSLHREHADAAAAENGAGVIPLYRQPQPALTDEERQAILTAIQLCEDITYGGAADQHAADVLRSLLERSK